MIRLLAILFGIAFIFGGVAGFVPTFIQDGMLFGYFMVDGLHNIVYIVSGVIAIMSATSDRYARLYFQIFGLIYTAVAVWGFWTGGDLYMMHVNLAVNVLHIVIGVLSLIIGFSPRTEK